MGNRVRPRGPYGRARFSPDDAMASLVQQRRRQMFVNHLDRERPVEELEAEVRTAFKAYGTVEQLEVLCDGSGVPRGYAYVKMRDPRAAHKAKRELDGTVLGTSSTGIKIRWALDTATLWVGDLAPTITSAMLTAAFSQFGGVRDSHIENEPPELGGGSKHFGFVEFTRRSVAAKVQALLSDNLFIFGNNPRPVRVEFALDTTIDEREDSPLTSGLDQPPPHFARPGSLEFDFALKWREITLAHKSEEDRVAEVHRQEREILRLEQERIYLSEVDKLKSLEAMGASRGNSSVQAAQAAVALRAQQNQATAGSSAGHAAEFVPSANAAPAGAQPQQSEGESGSTTNDAKRARQS